MYALAYVLPSLFLLYFFFLFNLLNCFPLCSVLMNDFRKGKEKNRIIENELISSSTRHKHMFLNVLHGEFREIEFPSAKW